MNFWELASYTYGTVIPSQSYLSEASESLGEQLKTLFGRISESSAIGVKVFGETSDVKSGSIIKSHLDIQPANYFLTSTTDKSQHLRKR